MGRMLLPRGLNLTVLPSWRALTSANVPSAMLLPSYHPRCLGFTGTGSGIRTHGVSAYETDAVATEAIPACRTKRTLTSCPPLLALGQPSPGCGDAVTDRWCKVHAEGVEPSRLRASV
jgi:hypothetical protein